MAGFIYPVNGGVPTALAGAGWLSSYGNGLVTINEQPAVAKILILDSNSRQLAGVTHSNSDGEWLKEHLSPTRKYTVIAIAPDGEEVISGKISVMTAGSGTGPGIFPPPIDNT